jgi:outer membrane protein assembly factor BamE (lipoprotein component of BamABCDE complex)
MFKPIARHYTVLAAPVILVLALATGACAPRIHNQGHEVDPERLAQIEPGKTNRDQVVEILGSPSSNSTFGPEIWYYVSQEVHSTLFFKPEINDRKIVAVEFNDEGIVSDVSTLGLADGRNVRPVERVTPTTGHELTVFEQVLGNFGRFSRKKTQPQVGGGGGIPPR